MLNTLKDTTECYQQVFASQNILIQFSNSKINSFPSKKGNFLHLMIQTKQ